MVEGPGPTCHDPYFHFFPEARQVYGYDLLASQLHLCKLQGRVDGWCKVIRDVEQQCSDQLTILSERLAAEVSRQPCEPQVNETGLGLQRVDLCANSSHGLFVECNSTEAESITSDAFFWTTLQNSTEIPGPCGEGSEIIDMRCHMQHGAELCDLPDIDAVGLGSAVRELPSRCRLHCYLVAE